MRAEWACGACTLLNPGTAAKCDACGCARAATVDTAAADADAGDTGTGAVAGAEPAAWSCHACTYRNPAPARVCEMCNSDKP